MDRHKKQIPKGAEQGTRYGGLVVLRVVEAAGQKSIIEFKCDCGCALTRRLYVAKKAGKLGRKAVCRECENKEKSESLHNRFKIENYIDRRFGRLVVTGYNYDPERKRPKTRLVCVCDCGAQTVVSVNSLMKGDTSSCGCMLLESMSKTGAENIKHGHTTNGVLNGHTPLYRAWAKIRAGVREGINAGFHKVCHEYDPRWDDFENFFKDFGDIAPSQTISRINNQMPWDAGNCYINIGRRVVKK